MNYFIKHIALALCLLVAPDALATPLTTITIPSQQYQLNYDHSVRVVTLLTAVNTTPGLISTHPFPLGFQLFDTNREPEAQELKQKVLEQLQSLAASEDKLSVSAQLLINQIKRWDIGYRLFTSLDWDQVRIEAKHNPLLRGNYELILTQRYDHVFFEGLVFKPQSLALSRAKSLVDYTQKLPLLSSAHLSYAWVIYPDGHVQRVGYALWNEQLINLTPNSVVFFGFDSDEPRFTNLEQDIVKLITMRKAQ